MIYGEDEADDLRREDRALRDYRNDLTRHPDCRDPAHPGCVCCMPENFPDDDQEPQ
jgi:hypothetical protein